MKGYCRILHDFSQETSAHGVPRIGRAHTKKVTCFWLLICSVCMVMFLTQTYSIFSRYFKYEKTTQIEMRFQRAKFPAVTLCNLNPFKKSLAKGIPGLASIIDAVETSQNRHERTARSVNTFETTAQENETLIYNNR
uniref:Uncharacterized protein n=1 Tax=Romanomermis culicivorax TaxID=13658 RepID=A0A915L5P7_ROMCU